MALLSYTIPQTAVKQAQQSKLPMVAACKIQYNTSCRVPGLAPNVLLVRRAAAPIRGARWLEGALASASSSMGAALLSEYDTSAKITTT